MAAFFPRTIYNTEASFTPLFRLLDDFDSYSRQCGSSSGKTKQQNCRNKSSPAVAHWQPKFDVRETSDAYELHGELPGLNKSDVSIEFTEPQTLVVRGKVERTYEVAAPALDAKQKSPKQLEPEESAAAAAPHKATVADEDDASVQEESGFEVVGEGSSAAQATSPITSASATATEAQVASAVPVNNSKYWLRERSIGEFSRSFGFPSRVDQDAVTASFQDGILSISVPKAKKHEPVRISIN